MITTQANMVYQLSVSTGTGNFGVIAINGHNTFDNAFGHAVTQNVLDYFISNRDAPEWERGTGHMLDANTLVRDTVLEGSNGTSAVLFSAGTKDVTSDLPAAKMVTTDTAQTISGQKNFSSNVGVGVESPSYSVDVSTGNGGGIRITSSNAPAVILSSTSAAAASRNWAVFTNYTTQGDFAIVTSVARLEDPTSGAVTSRFYIDPNGNIGVGTLTPGFPLDVVGVINSSSGYQISGAAASGHVLRGNGTSFVSSAPPLADLTGLGTGVATALAINVGSAGAFVTFNGALGTPSSGTLTNATGLPATSLTGTLQAVQEPAHTGDVTNSAGSLTLTLATVNSNTGSWGSATQVPQVTVNGKGLVTAVSNVTITPAVGSLTGLGTGVATALAINVGSAGAFVTFNGALGSPSSIGTLPAFTLGGTVAGGGNQINNVIIGTSTPLAGSFTTVTAGTWATFGASGYQGGTVSIVSAINQATGPGANLNVIPTITTGNTSILGAIGVSQFDPTKLTSAVNINGVLVNMRTGNAQPNQNAGVLSFMYTAGGADPFGGDFHGLIDSTATAAPGYAIGLQGSVELNSATYVASNFSVGVLGTVESSASKKATSVFGATTSTNAGALFILTTVGVSPMTNEGVVLTPADNLNAGTYRAFAITNVAGTNKFAVFKDGSATFASGNFTVDASGNLNSNNVSSNTQISAPLVLLNGATSGAVTLKAPAIAGSNIVTFPAGTTDFSATGGTSRVVKQVSAGAALTVAQLAFSDISGSVAASQMPALTGDVTTAAGAVATTLASVIAAGGPTGSATVVPVITYDAKGRLTAVTTATIAPAVGSITGLGTGVATALGVNVGSAGAFVTFGGALGSPSSAGTIPAFTLGGAISGNSQNLTNLATLAVGGSTAGLILGTEIAGINGPLAVKTTRTDGALSIWANAGNAAADTTLAVIYVNGGTLAFSWEYNGSDAIWYNSNLSKQSFRFGGVVKGEMNTSGDFNVTTSFSVGSTKVIGSRVTGYTAMTGSPDKATAYATSTVTLAQLAGRVAQLQADLTTHGLIGA